MFIDRYIFNIHESIKAYILFTILLLFTIKIYMENVFIASGQIANLNLQTSHLNSVAMVRRVTSTL